MGRRLTQKIYSCDICNETPADGEYMWYMGTEIWCEKCCDREELKMSFKKTKPVENKNRLPNDMSICCNK